MVRKRRLIAVLTMVLALIGSLEAMGSGAQVEAAAKRATVTAVRHHSLSASGNGSFLRLGAGTTGNIAYCAQGWLRTPEVGQTLELYGSPGIPELDYVLYHGYDGTVVTSVAGLSADKSELVTALAVWLAIGDQRPDLLNYTENGTTVHGNQLYRERWEIQTDQQVKDAAWDLYQAGLAYKKRGGGGIEEGCAELWTNRTPYTSTGLPEYQALVTVRKKITTKFSKTSSETELTDGNGTYSLKGARYDIFRASDDAKVASIETDENGRASCSLEPNTSFYAVETKAPAGFALNTERIRFKTGTDTGSVALSDKPGNVALTICKKDSATLGAAQRGASLAGAEFKVVSLSTLGWEAAGTTSDDGSLTIKNIPLGKIQVVETKAPEGYRLDETVHTYTIGADQLAGKETVQLIPENDFREDVIAFDIEIEKFLDEGDESASGIATPGSDISFDIISNTSNEVVGRITTDGSGHATTKGLWFGDGKRPDTVAGAVPFDRAGYTVREDTDTVPDGFKAAGDWQIGADQLADGTTLRYIVNNTVVSSRVRIVKQDAKSGQTVPLAGFSFALLDEDKNPCSQENWYPGHVELTEFTTDESGTVTFPERLRAGTYYIRETAAPAPYLLNREDVRFEIDSDEEPVVTVVMTDDQATGEASIAKTCSEDGSALAGAEYEVIAQEDIVSPDGTVQALKGERVAMVTTGEDGTATAKGLPLGPGTARYAFVEVKAPEGHVLNDAPLPFELSYKDHGTAMVRASVEASDEPTRITVKKSAAGMEDPLEGAVFQLWNADDELGVKPQEGFGTVAVRYAGNMHEAHMALVPVIDDARLAVEAPGGSRLVAIDGQEGAHELNRESSLEAGTYAIHIVRDGREEPVPGLEKVSVEKGGSYLLRVTEGLLGVGGTCEATEPQAIDLAFDANRNVLLSDEVLSGTYELRLDERELGTLQVDQGEVRYASVDEGELRGERILLTGDARPLEHATDAEGCIYLDHLPAGTYRLTEAKAPDGYLVDPEIHSFTIDEFGRCEGETDHTIRVDDDYTKVDISKRDVTTEEEIEGARLTITDKEGTVIESWVSTTEPHRIDALKPGTYTLTEQLTPRTYDMATSIEFTVQETGEVQPVVLYDEPIKIQGEVDKRQEIADPTAADTVENGDGKNTAEVSVSEKGEYDYSVDFRNTSTTWVDEFTVEDDLSAVTEGLATLRSITTPQTWGDFDGKLNVWYRTSVKEGNTKDRSGKVPQANATLSDRHENPWLFQESVKETLGNDARALEYSGWRLWASDVSAAERTTLEVDDLDLAEGERICGIRLEYGRVESGFASRRADWERDDLKSPHDDLDDVAGTHEESFETPGGKRTPYAPLMIHMQVTDDYREGISLKNKARVDLYRNGGGKDLEDHDEDRVTQTPRTTGVPLDQTGAVPAMGVFAPLITVIGALYALWRNLGRHNEHIPRRRR